MTSAPTTFSSLLAGEEGARREAVGRRGGRSLAKYKPGQSTYIEEVEVIERPLDRNGAGSGFYLSGD